MKRIIYYVAISMDGYISGKNDTISDFAFEGQGVDKYLADLSNYKTVVMGRKTYEMGYAFGLTPGQPAYQGMEHFIFSNTLILDKKADSVHIEKLDIDRIKEIKQESPTDIYLCGGGRFAGWLLEHNQIDQIKIKLNPIVLGTGTKLFSDTEITTKWKLIDTEKFEDGMIILTYNYVKND